MDRIDHHEPGKAIVARKLTSGEEPFWIRSDGELEMPPALVLESLCQAGSWLVYLSTGGTRTAALLSVAAAEFGAPARPGDVLVLEGNVESIDEERAVLSGTVSIAGETVLRATDIMCALIEVGRLEDPDALRRRAEVVLHGQAAG